MYWRGQLAPTQFLTRGGLLSLCVLVVLACDASPAWATCGDYLHGHGSMATHGTGPQHSQPVPGCHGPNCQRNNQSPVAPGKAIEIPVSSDAILTTIAALIRPNGFFALMLFQATVVDGPMDGIFRPPRRA